MAKRSWELFEAHASAVRGLKCRVLANGRNASRSEHPERERERALRPVILEPCFVNIACFHDRVKRAPFSLHPLRRPERQSDSLNPQGSYPFGIGRLGKWRIAHVNSWLKRQQTPAMFHAHQARHQARLVDALCPHVRRPGLHAVDT